MFSLWFQVYFCKNEPFALENDRLREPLMAHLVRLTSFIFYFLLFFLQ